MDMPPLSTRNVVKYVVKSVMFLQVSKMTEDALIDYTRFEEDDIVVKVAPKVVAWVVSDKLKPVTDKAVDTTADFINAQREKRRNAKKDETEEQ